MSRLLGLLSHLFHLHFLRAEKVLVSDILYLATSAELLGAALSSVAAVLMSDEDIEIPHKVKARPFVQPDQAGKMNVHVFVSGDMDDMKPERDILFSSAFPVLDRWFAEFRVQFVPVDMRYGVSRPEAYHQDVVRMHMDQIDHCFPFFVAMLGESYGWIPDDHFRNYGALDHERFNWIKELPERVSLVHLEIMHAYLRKKLDGDGPGGGHDDDYCLFYFRDKAWLDEPTYITDAQLQHANLNAAKKQMELKAFAEEEGRRQMNKLAAGQDQVPNVDYVDVHVVEGLDLAFFLDHKEEAEELKDHARAGGGGGDVTGGGGGHGTELAVPPHRHRPDSPRLHPG